MNNKHVEQGRSGGFLDYFIMLSKIFFGLGMFFELKPFYYGCLPVVFFDIIAGLYMYFVGGEILQYVSNNPECDDFIKTSLDKFKSIFSRYENARFVFLDLISDCIFISGMVYLNFFGSAFIACLLSLSIFLQFRTVQRLLEEPWKRNNNERRDCENYL